MEEAVLKKWTVLADARIVGNVTKSLSANGIDAYYVETGGDAKRKLFELLPEKAEILDVKSMTIEKLGISEIITTSDIFVSVNKKIEKLNRIKDAIEIKRLISAPEYLVGSVQAVTMDGHILVASKTGSEISGYAYGSKKVIWIVGTHKIVTNISEGINRIYEYFLPLEVEERGKAGELGTAIGKLLIFNREVEKNRVSLIFVNEVLGF